MEEQIPKEFMCPNCKVDIRIAGLYQRVWADYAYDYDQKKFVIIEVDPDGDERLFCRKCLEELSFGFEDGLKIDTNVNFKRKVTRYGNIMIEEEYKR